MRYGDKYVSIRGDDDPYTIELPRALELIELKKIEDANRIIQDFEEEGIQVLNGRYGPVHHEQEERMRACRRTGSPKSLTLEECQELLAAAPERGRRGKKKSEKEDGERLAAPKKAAAKKESGKEEDQEENGLKKKTAKKAAKKEIGVD